MSFNVWNTRRGISRQCHENRTATLDNAVISSVLELRQCTKINDFTFYPFAVPLWKATS